jgi:hypothetical protein
MKNESAFPWAIDDGQKIVSNKGMTLRDYFAASVIHGLIPQYREMFMDNTLDDWVGDAIPSLAQEAYMIADAMLIYREQK